MSDLIDREAAIDAIYHHSPRKSREECAMILHEVTSQPEQKKGKWVKNEDGTWSCSLCHSWISYDQHYYARYCLYCGAKMEGEGN